MLTFLCMHRLFPFLFPFVVYLVVKIMKERKEMGRKCLDPRLD